MISGAALFALLLLGAYAYLVARSKGGEALLKWKGTCAILALHTQTVSIVYNLSLTWPPAAEVAMTPFQVLGGRFAWLQPECVLSSARWSKVAPPCWRL